MNMKKLNFTLFVKIIVPIVLLTISIFLMSYGNIKNHRSINGFIVESFLKKDSSKTLSPEYKNYKFEFKKGSLKGNYISKTGLFNHASLNQIAKDPYLMTGLIDLANSTIEEEWGGKTAKDWIVHGGFSADEPEVPASLRHFYDPTRSEGDRYLSDAVNSKLLNVIQSKIFGNPRTDGVEWALGTKGPISDTRHIYTWKYGKEFMKKALEEADIENRNKFMAKSWRALGETLHMIADNGCPAHVRNDAHPSIPYLSYFGNPDFYEEDMALRKDLISGFNTGNVPKSLKSKFEKEKTAESIAHELAVFTNNNFFTTETISGTDWKGNTIKQITHPDYEYSNPKLSSGNYEKNYYRTTIDGVQGEVLLATDTWFFMKYPISKTYPYINEEVVTSQAKVLIPAIVEAGAQVIKLFIPKLKINILEIEEDGTIKGKIVHKIDKEYTETIYYNGPVSIKLFGISEIAKFNAEGGQFSGKLDVTEKTYAKAEIEFGGVAVQSDQFEVLPKKKEEKNEENNEEVKNNTKEKAWVLVGTEIDSKTERLKAKNKSYKNVYKFEQNQTKNSNYSKQTYIGKTDRYYNPPTLNGEFCAVQFNWSDPPAVIHPNKKVSLQLSGSVTAEDQSFYNFSFQLSASCCIYTKGADDANWCDKLLNSENKNVFACNKKSRSFNEKVTIDDIRKGEEDEILFVRVSGGIEGASTKFIYEWK
jgi:hypothetical protein